MNTDCMISTVIMLIVIVMFGYGIYLGQTKIKYQCTTYEILLIDGEKYSCEVIE